MSSVPSTSSVGSPPHAPFRPFSLLPDELIEAILEATVPFHYSSRTYPTRQSTLCSLCLVSKLFHQIAKPLLFAVVHLSPSSAVKWQNSIGGTGSNARELLVGDGDTGDKHPDYYAMLPNIKSIVHLCRDLTTLSLNNCVSGGLDISELSSAPHLTTLRLTYLDVTLSGPASLSRVEELSLRGVRSSSPFPSIFNPTIFPSLLAFTWNEAEDDDIRDGTMLNGLVDQVEAFALDGWILADLDLDQGLLDQLKEKTLYDDYHRDFDLPHTKYLRLFNPDQDTEDPIEVLDEFGTYLSKSPWTLTTRPSVLYLPPWLEHSYFELNPDGTGEVNFRRECRTRKIEVVFEEQPGSRTLETEVPRDFRRRLKERQAIESRNDVRAR